MIDNTSLLLQVIGLLSKIAEASGAGGGSGASSVTVLNPSTNYSLETTQQDSLTRLADILTELQGTLQVQEQNPITGFNLESTQQDLLTQLQSLVTNTTSPLSVTETVPITGFNLEATQQDVLLELQKSKDFEIDYFVDLNEDPGTPQSTVYRENLYDRTTDTYSYTYYKLDALGGKTVFDVGASSGIDSLLNQILYYLYQVNNNTLRTIPNLQDYSSTITISNVSQLVRSSNPLRRYLLIQNISDTDMYINFGAAATVGSGSIKLIPNGNYELIASPGGFMITEDINIICSVAGKEFTTKEV